MRNNKIITKITPNCKQSNFNNIDLSSFPNDVISKEFESSVPEENPHTAEQFKVKYNHIRKVIVRLRKPSQTPKSNMTRKQQNILPTETILMREPNATMIQQAIEVKTENSIGLNGNNNYCDRNTSKSVQTKYGYNNICGIVDIWDFHLNCVFCTKTYKLQDWQEFLRHLKAKHEYELFTTESATEYLDNEFDEKLLKQEDSEESDEVSSNFDNNEYQEEICREKNESDVQNNYHNNINPATINDSNSNSCESNSQLIGDYNSYSNVDFQDVVKYTEVSKEFTHLEQNPNMDHCWEYLENSETDGTFAENDIDYDDELPQAVISSGTNLSENTTWHFPDVIEEVAYSNNHAEADVGDDEPIIEDQEPVSINISNNEDVYEINGVDDDEMPSNNEDEDDVPKPTRGCGILFGLTNRQVVVDFLENLKKYPLLYRSEADCTRHNYDTALTKLRLTLNEKYRLGITDTEMRTSIQRVNDWYYRTLHKLRQHNKCNAGEPFHHRFAMYFEMCQEFLTGDFSSTDLSTSMRNGVTLNTCNQMVKYPPWVSFPPEDNAVTVAKITTKKTSNQDKSESSKPSDESIEEKPKRFECDICGKMLTQKATLQTHKFFHTKPNFKCNICDKVFFRKFWLDCHKKSHHNKPAVPYICEFCGKAIYSKGTFRMHKLSVHMNVRYTCVVCNYQTQTQRYLLRHQIKRHLALEGTLEELAKKMKPQGMRLIPSNREYRDGYLWKMSIRKPGQRIFSCITCQLVFDRYKDVLHHNKQFHPVRHKSYICLLCPPGKTLMRSSLRRHYTVVHKIPIVELEDWMSRTKHVKSISEIVVNQEKNASELNPGDSIDNLFLDVKEEGIERVEEETVFSDTEIMTTDDYIEIDNNIVDDFSHHQIGAQCLPESIDYEQIFEQMRDHQNAI